MYREQGDGEGDTPDLLVAIAAYRRGVEGIHATAGPLDWAVTQNSLRQVLTTLRWKGERDGAAAGSGRDL